MKILKNSYTIVFLFLFLGLVLAITQYLSPNQFMIYVLACIGVSSVFYGSEKLAKESIIKGNKNRIIATLTVIIFFLSSSLFVYYPTLEGVLALAVITFSISFTFQLTEWYEKAKLYDQIKAEI